MLQLRRHFNLPEGFDFVFKIRVLGGQLGMFLTQLLLRLTLLGFVSGKFFLVGCLFCEGLLLLEPDLLVARLKLFSK